MSIRKELDEIYGMLDPKNEIDREIREKITLRKISDINECKRVNENLCLNDGIAEFEIEKLGKVI